MVATSSRNTPSSLERTELGRPMAPSGFIAWKPRRWTSAAVGSVLPGLLHFGPLHPLRHRNSGGLARAVRSPAMWGFSIYRPVVLFVALILFLACVARRFGFPKPI